MFHNKSDYDAHFFIKELGKNFNKGDIEVIAETKEKYVGFNEKIDVKLSRVTNDDVKEVRKNIQLKL